MKLQVESITAPHAGKIASRRIAMKNLLIALCIWLPVSVAAQQPAFEVASIRAANPSGPIKSHTRVGPENIDFLNVTLFECIRRAYAVRPYQLIGPAWINTARY